MPLLGPMLGQKTSKNGVSIGVVAPHTELLVSIARGLAYRGFSPVYVAEPRTDPAQWLGRRFDAILFEPYWSENGPKSSMTMMRGIAGDTPVLALTPNDCAIERTAALNSGADDAIYASGNGEEIAARIASLVRRQRMGTGNIIICDELEINLINRHVARAGNSIAMPLREFDLLSHLARQRDQPVSRRNLLRAVWHIDFDPGTNRIDVHMSRLRQRVDYGYAHAMLRTVKGIGYALVSRSGAHAVAAMA